MREGCSVGVIPAALYTNRQSLLKEGTFIGNGLARVSDRRGRISWIEEHGDTSARAVGIAERVVLRMPLDGVALRECVTKDLSGEGEAVGGDVRA